MGGRAPNGTFGPSVGVGMTRLCGYWTVASNAIHGAIEVADWVYKQAGINSIFDGSLFQRRFRDIHTLSQQIQSRDTHFESIGQVLLGKPPKIFY